MRHCPIEQAFGGLAGHGRRATSAALENGGAGIEAQSGHARGAVAGETLAGEDRARLVFQTLREGSSGHPQYQRGEADHDRSIICQSSKTISASSAA